MYSVVLYGLHILIISLQVTYNLEVCELVEALRYRNLTEDLVFKWVCIAQAATELDQHYFLIEEPNGTKSYGIFRINDMACSTMCRSCEDLSIHLADSIDCAFTLYEKEGFKYWNWFYSHCPVNDIDISKCPKIIPLPDPEPDPEVQIEVEGRLKDRCELVMLLSEHCFQKSLLADWVCLVEASSSLRYNAIGYNPDGSRSHGLFQISDRHWCNNQLPALKGCKQLCSDFRTENITMAANCARMIYRQQGFNAWFKYKKNCHIKKPNIAKCSIASYDGCMSPDDKCAVLQELYYANFSLESLHDWDCILDHESAYKFSLMKRNIDGSISHGIFQINDRFWCNTSPNPGKGCNVLCRDLRTSNYKAAAHCARKIYDQNGFSAWFKYRIHCYGKIYPKHDCDITTTTTSTSSTTSTTEKTVSSSESVQASSAVEDTSLECSSSSSSEEPSAPPTSKHSSETTYVTEPSEPGSISPLKYILTPTTPGIAINWAYTSTQAPYDPSSDEGEDY